MSRQTLYTKKSGCQGATTQNNARSATSYLLISLNDKKPQSGANFQTRRQRDMIQDQTIGVISSNSSKRPVQGTDADKIIDAPFCLMDHACVGLRSDAQNWIHLHVPVIDVYTHSYLRTLHSPSSLLDPFSLPHAQETVCPQ
jgi:hypothetical protein